MYASNPLNIITQLKILKKKKYYTNIFFLKRLQLVGLYRPISKTNYMHSCVRVCQSNQFFIVHTLKFIVQSQKITKSFTYKMHQNCKKNKIKNRIM